MLAPAIMIEKEVSAMNEYSSLRRRKRSIWISVVALALCVALSASMLFSRLSGYSLHHTQHYIPLTVSNGVTQVTPMQRQLSQTPTLTLLSASDQGRVMPMEETKPAQTEEAWLTITELELFCVSYENGEGKVTVQSANGDNIVAPGTSHSFTFSLQNTAEFGLDYDIEIEAYFAIEGGNEKVPVQLRLFDHSGNYLIGSPEEFEDLSDVNVASGEGSVSAGYIVPYTIEWCWPFEGDDIYDTALGSYFIETNAQVSFVMEVRTIAERGGEGGLPNTGDRNLVFPAAALCVSASALVFILIPWKRKREDENAQQ